MTLRRVVKLRARFPELDIESALILNPTNVGYLSGFTGSTAALLVTGSRAVFITDSRYRLQADRECPSFEIAITPRGGAYGETIGEQAREVGARSLGLEGDFVTLAQHEQLAKNLDGITLKPVGNLVGALRRIKEEDEIARIRAACRLTDRAFEFLLTCVRPGRTEREVAVELEYFMKREGGQKEAFDSVVASGPRSALPHGRASERVIQAGDFVTFDFGTRIRGYSSDLTRTIVLGSASAKQREVYGIVLEAQLAALAAIRPGAEAKAVDAVARDLITARGYGDCFGHGLGHGLGREVHDHAGFSPRSEVVLAEGMVLTVEPGIYIDGWGGVRIEDDVVVRSEGCEILSQAPKELIEIPE